MPLSGAAAAAEPDAAEPSPRPLSSSLALRTLDDAAGAAVDGCCRRCC